LSLNKSEIISLNHPWNRTFEKLFSTFDKNVVKQCQLYQGLLDILHYYSVKSMSFFINISTSHNLIVKTISAYSENDDMYRPSNYFNCNNDLFIKHYKEIIYKHFEESV